MRSATSTVPAGEGLVAGRMTSIDVVRGVAILWVLAYHLWSDLRFPDVYPDQADAFREVAHQLTDADVLGAAGAALEAILRVGYLGVPLFMMLSGVSLTLTALRRHSHAQLETKATPRRLRRLLVPYWAGFGITISFAAALAFVQWQRHGGAPYVDFLRNGDINLHTDQLIAGALLVPRMFRNEWQFAPEGSLWFVIVVVQYYLLFPFMLAVLRRTGPLSIVLGTLALTAGSVALMIAATGDLLERRSWVETAAPFRIFEFGVGIAIGYALVKGTFERMYAPLTVFASVIAGVVIFVAGCFVPIDGGYVGVLQWPLVIGGLALMFAPVLMNRGEFALPGRMLASVGVLSYALLIVNEPLRSITHTMRAEGAAGVWVAAWVIVGFIPLTFLLARPLALRLGLIDRERPLIRVEDVWSLQAAIAPHANGATTTRTSGP